MVSVRAQPLLQEHTAARGHINWCPLMGKIDLSQAFFQMPVVGFPHSSVQAVYDAEEKKFRLFAMRSSSSSSESS